MALTTSTAATLGSQAPDFKLLGVDGKSYELRQFLQGAQSPRALVVVFMCNHCPYVIAVQDRINALARKYLNQKVQFLGINSNDTVRYPADNYEAMIVRSQERGFVFPYLWDETQEVAKAYDAACTPEFYLYSIQQGKTSLEYKGRLDDSWKDESQVTRQELRDAIEAVLTGKKPSSDQKPSMGCGIKWK